MSDKKPKNPSAFPLSCGEHGLAKPEFGMTLRDYFAGQALAGIQANAGIDTLRPEEYASDCYLYADAMLVERAKQILKPETVKP